jgi:hypothetical protein
MTIKDAFRKAKAILSQVKFSKATLIDGTVIQFDADQIEAGSNVFLVDGANDFALLADGAYLTKSQVNFTVVDGIIADVTSKPVSDENSVNGPVKQAQSADDLDDDNPGGNDGKPTKVAKDSTKGKGSIDLDKDKKPYGDVEYADPKNGKYPIDTVEHIRAAWNYINKGNAEGDVSAIKSKIIAAWKKKIDPAGPPSAQKQSTDEVDAEMGSGLVSPPGGGAPDSLINPTEIAADSDYATCMSKMNELHAQHNFLQQAHDKLRSEHDATNAHMNSLIDVHNKLANKFDDMCSKFDEMKSDLKKATDDKLLMSKQLEVISKQPSASAIEEITTSVPKKQDPDIINTKAYRVMSAK